MPFVISPAKPLAGEPVATRAALLRPSLRQANELPRAPKKPHPQIYTTTAPQKNRPSSCVSYLLPVPYLLLDEDSRKPDSKCRVFYFTYQCYISILDVTCARQVVLCAYHNFISSIRSRSFGQPTDTGVAPWCKQRVYADHPRSSRYHVADA